MSSAPVDKPPPHPCTAARVRKVARLVTQLYDHHLEPCCLTLTQFGVLGHIRTDDGVGLGALAQRMVMDPTTLTRALRPLETRGLVQLTPDPHDRRHKRLHLTEEGRGAWEAAHPFWQAAQAEVRHRLGGQDIEQFHAVLDGAIDRLAR
jgi:DNA-binding MarR family transcriptional regulator